MSATVLALIPARGGSKGIPAKNVAALAGKPLIGYTIRAAQGSEKLTDVVVSTDSEAIANVCRELGAQVPALRPAELSTDSARVQNAVRYALQEWFGEKRYEYVLLLQPTAPFRSSADIDAAIALAEKHNANSVVSFTEEETRHPYYMYRFERSDEAGEPSRVEALMQYKVGMPRQEVPSFVYRNGAIYLTRVDYLLEHDGFVSEDVVPYLMPASRSVNIDTPEDLQYAEFLIQSGAVDIA